MYKGKHVTKELSRLMDFDGATGESELERAVRHYNQQRGKGWSVEDVLTQIRCYGERIHYRINSMVVLGQLT